MMPYIVSSRWANHQNYADYRSPPTLTPRSPALPIPLFAAIAVIAASPKPTASVPPLSLVEHMEKTILRTMLLKLSSLLEEQNKFSLVHKYARNIIHCNCYFWVFFVPADTVIEPKDSGSDKMRVIIRCKGRWDWVGKRPCNALYVYLLQLRPFFECWHEPYQWVQLI